MALLLTPEHRELAGVVRSFLAEHSPESEVRRLADDPLGWNPRVWSLATDQLGLPALAIPAEYGGAGYGLVELGVCFEETGRALFCAPLLSGAGLAANLLLASGDDGACREFLPGIAAGTTIASVAVTEDAAGQTIDTRAEHTSAGWTVTGTKTHVLDGHAADLLLVIARTPTGLGAFAVQPRATELNDTELNDTELNDTELNATEPNAGGGLVRSRQPALDQTRPLARVELRATPARLVGRPDLARADLERVLDVGRALLAMEQVGGIARVLEMAVAYARTRVQFGRPIGSFQAVKHRCADMLVSLETARSAAYTALAEAAGQKADGTELARSAGLAKAHCSEAYSRCAADNIHVHGGIGVTWEHSAQLYLKRAKSSEVLLGSPAEHRRRLGTLTGLTGDPRRANGEPGRTTVPAAGA